ncbi:MAG: peptidoglycan -binding protein [Alphaproteobacteria bacterium]|nr:peptidoglycan -binding protein [Alphaproteobacteria bacterium]
MSLANRRSRTAFDIWPGFVDALATLLMVIIFLLMIFVVAQFYLNDALLGRDKALDSLNKQVAELAELLDLERKSNTDLRRDLAEISSELQSSLSQRDDLQAQWNTMSEQLGEAKRAFEEANRATETSKEALDAQLNKLRLLQQDIIALRALKEQMEKDLKKARIAARSGKQRVATERELSLKAKAQVALLNKQLVTLRKQIATLNAALQASELKDKEQQTKIADLGKRLNAALARKVQELARYRSEFFGRLRVVLGNRQDIRVVGDRFVFQSEVLFDSGSAELGGAGKEQLSRLAGTLKTIAARIPTGINWVLRVDGHTDSVPISNERFPSNWELSAARAISVVKHLKSRGIPPGRLAAAGFGEFHPLAPGRNAAARQRNRRIEIKLDQR